MYGVLWMEVSIMVHCQEQISSLNIPHKRKLTVKTVHYLWQLVIFVVEEEFEQIAKKREKTWDGKTQREFKEKNIQCSD